MKTSTHYINAKGQHYLPKCLQNIEIEAGGTIFLRPDDIDDDVKRDDIGRALRSLGVRYYGLDDDCNIYIQEMYVQETKDSCEFP